MFGFKPDPVNVISLLLINGTKETLVTLSPKLDLTVFGTNAVRIPDRVWPTLCSVDIVVVVILLLPWVLVFVTLFDSWTAPTQVSFQLFQIVPRFKSKTPSEARVVRVS